jgi:CheY-like chemotaxis protein
VHESPTTRVLIVEDDAATRGALSECLCVEGYEVICATNGAEALTLLRTERLPDVILLDLMLPEIDGWDFRAAQKRDPNLARIPVIALSAVGKLVDAEASLRKPIRVEELLEVVSRVSGAAARGRQFPS